MRPLFCLTILLLTGCPDEGKAPAAAAAATRAPTAPRPAAAAPDLADLLAPYMGDPKDWKGREKGNRETRETHYSLNVSGFAVELGIPIAAPAGRSVIFPVSSRMRIDPARFGAVKLSSQRKALLGTKMYHVESGPLAGACVRIDFDEGGYDTQVLIQNAEYTRTQDQTPEWTRCAGP